MIKLKDIKEPQDIKGLDDATLNDLASQMRQALLQWVSTIGGHTMRKTGMSASLKIVVTTL